MTEEWLTGNGEGKDAAAAEELTGKNSTAGQENPSVNFIKFRAMGEFLYTKVVISSIIANCPTVLIAYIMSIVATFSRRCICDVLVSFVHLLGGLPIKTVGQVG